MIVVDKPLVETLAIHTLGGVGIALQATPAANTAAGDWGQRRLRFETRTVEALLIYLACHGRPLERDLLAELLWPERSQEQALANLRTAIHRLRQQLAPYLLITRQHIALNPNGSIVLDVTHFEADLRARRLATATTRYRGDFLQGFYLEGSPLFEQWALLERERLRTLAISAYQQHISQAAANHQVEEAIASAQRLLHLDPLHEPTHRQLMRLLAQAGQRSAALTQYENCRQLLLSELAVPPDEATTTLAEQIRQGELRITNYELRADTTIEQSFVTRNSELVTRHNLPLQPTPFIGRTTELTQIEQVLANPDCRLLTLLGVGGIGKTRLVIEAAKRQMHNFADGICFVALAGVGKADVTLLTLAQSLGIQATDRDLLAQVAGYLQPRQLLLVLDNFEHLLAAAEIVAHLLQSAAQIKVLVTSRQRLYLLEEWLLPLAGLSTHAVADEAGELFLRTAQRVRPDFAAQGQEAAIATICRQVEGMPLALELAASWVRIMSCAEIAQQMKVNLDFLTTPLRNLPERHRSIRALLEQSWRLLSPAEQTLFMRLSVFQGGWRLEEAIQILDFPLTNGPPSGQSLFGKELKSQIQNLLLGLVDKSLVRVAELDRFTMHELVRQYAAEQLAASGEGDWIHRQHFVVYLQLLRTADHHLRGGQALTWYARIDPELDNIRAALQWALTGEQFVDAAWLAVALAHFWSVRAHWHEALRWLEQLLPRRHHLPGDLRLATLLSLYHFWRSQEAFQPIDRHLAELIELQEASAHKLLQAAAWRSIAVASAEFTQAVAAWDHCLSYLDAASQEAALDQQYGVYADLVYQQAFALFRYAIRLTDVGEYDQAERLSGESLTLFRRRDNRDYILFPLGNLGRLALLRGDRVQARLLLQEAVTIATQVGNRMGLCDWQPRFAIATLYCGDSREAERLLLESLSLARDLKSDIYLSRIYTYLAETALWENDQARAAQWLTQAAIHHTNPRWVRTELVDCLWVAARLAMMQQQYVRAATIFGLAEQVSQRIRYPLVEPVQSRVNTALATVQAALEPAAFADAFAAGREMTLEGAFTTLFVSDQRAQ